VEYQHFPVMAQEVVEYLDPKPGEVFIDATLGMGGHSREILARIMPGGVLIGIDRDKESLEKAGQSLCGFSQSCRLLHGNYANIDILLKDLSLHRIDGIVMDLGVSSVQLQDAGRGFSFQSDGPLDMRMDRTENVSAYDLVNALPEDEFSRILRDLGEERWHNRIARLVAERRREKPISTTRELAEIVFRAIPVRFRRSYYRIHPATRTFQALRIAVNKELEALQSSLEKMLQILSTGGRLCVISFHSLEDRIVKHSFRKAAGEGCIEILTRKPVTPRESELQQNPASRSAKLRAAKRL
jgi:16S rRNA (cytosine1402-N4)-methyltransferase